MAGWRSPMRPSVRRGGCLPELTRAGPDEALRYVDTAVTVRCQLSGSDARYPLRIEVCRSGAFVPLCRMSLMMRDPDLFMLVAAMTCGPELAPESCFANEVREKLLSSV
jgi:hypothetical protein